MSLIIKSTATALLICIAAAAVSAAGIEGEPTEPIDLEVFRPSTGVWYSRSQDETGSFSAVNWGLESDVLVPADYDGDGDIDVAVWRPETGVWHIQLSSTGASIYHYWGKTTYYPTGALPDVPVPADFDGDGLADIAVWRPDTGVWYVLFSTEDHNVAKARYYYWGTLGDIPVPADYDGDGRTDVAVFRSWESNWYILESLTQKIDIRNFGIAGYDRLVPADYTGDGRTDPAVFRNGIWYTLDRTTGEIDSFHFGFPDSIAIPDDYDADGTADHAVFRQGTWYVFQSSTASIVSHTFGLATDIPLASLKTKPSIVGVP